MMRDDHGFTLIELLLSVMLMGTIVAAVSGALLVMFTTTEDTTQRLSESPDLQIASVYFGSDVQSAEVVDVATGTCGSDPGLTPLLDLSWRDPGALPAIGDDTNRTASYFVATAGNQRQLVRKLCVGAEVPHATTLVNYVNPTTMPTVTCTSAECAIETKICTADGTNVCTSEELTFTLLGNRRTS